MDNTFYSKLLTWIANDKLVMFYKSARWRKLRQQRMRLDNNECQLCKHEGKYHKAEMVHHKIHVRDNPMLALDMDNLMSLCNECHNREHPEKLILNEKKFVNEERW